MVSLGSLFTLENLPPPYVLPPAFSNHKIPPNPSFRWSQKPVGEGMGKKLDQNSSIQWGGKHVVFIKPEQNTLKKQKCILKNNLSMAASVWIETVISKLLRLLFKNVLLGNYNRKQHKNKKFLIVHCTFFRGNWNSGLNIFELFKNLVRFQSSPKLIA